MPRKSAAALALTGAAHALIQRPAPPADLTDLQKRYWVEISNPLPADWWGEDNKALLAEYCRTLTTLSFINQKIDEYESMPGPINAKAYLTLVARRESLVRVMFSQATKMRLTQSTRYDHKHAHLATEKPKAPTSTWEFK